MRRTPITTRVLGILLCAALAVHVGRTARADDDDENASKRNEILQKLDDALGRIASDLGGVGDASDAGGIGDALSQCDQISSLLSDLGNVANDDTRDILASWPSYVGDLRERLGHLRALKEGQYRVDRAPAKCHEAEEKLTETIRAYLDKRDQKGVTQIPMKARAIGEVLKDHLAQAAAQDEIMRREAQAAHFGASGGRWSDVSAALNESAAHISEYWQKALEAAHDSCDELAKGDEDQAVVKAVADLSRKRSETAEELDRIKAEQRKWFDELAELRTWWKQDTAAIREAMCNDPESPGDGQAGMLAERTIDETSDRMKEHIASRWSDMEARGHALLDRLDAVAKEEDDDAREQAGKLRTELADAMASVERYLLDSGVGQGSLNPRIRTLIETGKNEHKRIQADSSKCTAAEITLGSYRMDCVRVDGATCTIVEIKPNNSEARSKGEDQLNDYIRAVADYAKDKKKRDELTGDMAVFRPCFDEQTGAISLAVELRVYEFCPAEGQIFQDFAAP